MFTSWCWCSSRKSSRRKRSPSSEPRRNQSHGSTSEPFCANCQMSITACNRDLNNHHPSHTHGPVDGSLYATVFKPAPRSCLASNQHHHQSHTRSSHELHNGTHQSKCNKATATTSTIATPNGKGITFSLPEDDRCELDQMTIHSGGEHGPHTNSIDSGISSAASGHGSNTHNNPNNPQHSPGGVSSCGGSSTSGVGNGSGGRGSSVGPTVNGKHDSGVPSPVSVEVEVHSNGSGENTNTYHDSNAINTKSLITKREQDELDELVNGLLETVASFPDPIAPSGRSSVKSLLLLNHFEKPFTPENQTIKRPTSLLTTAMTAKVATEVHFPRVCQTDETDSVHFHPWNNKPSSPRISPDMRTSVQETTRRVPMTEEERIPNDSPAKEGRPFSYGITAGSPAIQRRRLHSETTAYVCESTPTRVSQQNNNNNSMTTTRDHSVGADVDGSVVIDDGASDVFSDYCHHPPHQQHDSSQGLTWLQRQQQKLKAKHESRELLDRQIREQRLLAELRGTVCKRVPVDVESSRESSPGSNSVTLPIHVNTNGHNSSPITVEDTTKRIAQKVTLSRQSSAPVCPVTPPRRSSKILTVYPQNAMVNRPTVVTDGMVSHLQRRQSDTSSDRERPFVAIKRAQESQMHPRTNPQDALASLTYDSLYHNRNYQMPSSSQQRNGLNQFKRGSEFSNKHNLSESKSVPAVEDDSMSPNYSMVDHSTPKNPFVDAPYSWSPSLVSVGSPPGSPSQAIERPETPNFPITPRTPYVNASTPTQEYFIRRHYRTSSLNSNHWCYANKASSSHWPQPYNYYEYIGATSKPSSPSSNAPRLVPVKSALTPTPGIQSTCYPTSENGGGQSHFDNGSVYYGHSRRSSTTSMNETSESMAKNIAFVQDTSKYWYKPKISREEAIALLKDKPPGTFVVRDSTSFPGAFGLAIKVAVPPPNVQNKTGDISSELVRHFLIEPTKKGVQIKACANEHEFGSLPALISEHSVRPMSLPCKLIIPQTHLCPVGEVDVVDGRKSAATDHSLSTNMLVDPTEIGAACNVLYLLTVDTESLTGPQAVRKAVAELFSMKPAPVATVVHFKVSACGITLTDNRRRLFFRKHYVLSNISHCGLDPDDRRWENPNNGSTTPASRCFGFVARKQASKTDNQCHVFAEYETGQPATAIVNFMNRVLALDQQKKSLL